MASFQALRALLQQGMQPTDRMVWIGLDFALKKRNAIMVSSASLPSREDCRAVAGLDVIVVGHCASYGPLRRLCGSLYQANPRILQLIDLGFEYVVYLKKAWP